MPGMSHASAITRWFNQLSFDFMARHDRLPGLRRAMQEIDACQYRPPEEIEAHQRRELRRLVQHAYATVPYYRRIFDERDLRPAAIRSTADLAALPFLTKALVQEHYDDLLSRAFGPSEIHTTRTGGTTAARMTFARDNASRIPKEGAALCFESWAGWSIGRPLGIVWPAAMDLAQAPTWRGRVKNRLYRRTMMFYAYQSNVEILSGFVREIKRTRPAMLRGFVNPLYELAQHCETTGERLPPLEGIVTTGEMLAPHQRVFMEQIFACPVFDSYRSRELGPIAQECLQQNGLHLNAHGLICESLDVDAVPELVCTDLYNYGMPFIRYRTGDSGILAAEPCPCGRNTPRIVDLGGRLADVLLTRDGRRIQPGALIAYVVLGAPGRIGQMQIVQEAYERLVVYITTDPPISTDVRAFQIAKLKEYFGEATEVEYREVPALPREASGKTIFSKCLIERKI